MNVCTWAPTVFAGPKLTREALGSAAPSGARLNRLVRNHVARVEALGLTHMLIAQRWWGNAREIEASSLDCLAMTSHIAAVSQRIQLVTAIHPGFFQPAVIAKWAATLSHLTEGRWSINLTSGWNLDEFDMYGVDALSHDQRYERSKEFIKILKGAWQQPILNFSGKYYRVKDLVLEPRPFGGLEVFQGGQSDAAIEMACEYSDWMFLNGGSLDKIRGIIGQVRNAAGSRMVPKFAVYAIPLCRSTDEEAKSEIHSMLASVDPEVLAARKTRVTGAEGMWSSEEDLSLLDSNEGYVTGLIGSPDTILAKVKAFKDIGVDMFHLQLGDDLFEEAVLPKMLVL